MRATPEGVIVPGTVGLISWLVVYRVSAKASGWDAWFTEGRHAGSILVGAVSAPIALFGGEGNFWSF